MDNIFINNIIDNVGRYDYAYVVMLIKKDIYASASIVFAESLRKIGCLGDLVIMIDEDINIETIGMIKKFYNKIVKIEPIEIKNNNSVQQIILSKIHAFNLIEYKKIFIIDIDTIIFTNIDKYFIDSNVPSVCLLENKLNYGFLLVEPSNETYNKSIKLIKKYKYQLEKTQKPFEFLINKLFSDVNQIDVNLSSINYLNVDGIQYIGDKPFLMTSSLTIEERILLNRFKIWFSCFIGILNKYPELKKIKSICETIEVSKYFLAPMSRFIIQLVRLGKRKKIDQITHIYGKHKFNNLEYYHLDISKNYSGEYLNYLSNINGIKIFLQYLNTVTNINFYKYNNYNSKEIINLLKQTNTISSTNTSINTYAKSKNKIDQSQFLNLFLNYYLKIFPNVFVVIEYNVNEKQKKKINKSDNTIKKEFENNLLYKNELYLSGQILSNIMFNIYQNYTYTQRLDMLKSIYFNENYKFNYYIYETIGQIVFFDIVSITANTYVLFDKSSKNRFASIFFNPNTLVMFKNQHIFCNYISCKNNENDKTFTNKIFLNKNSLINLIYFQTLKKWLFGTYSGSEMENIIIGEIESESRYDMETIKESKLDRLYKLILIDNVTTNIGKVKKIKDSKIFFIEIIFLKISQYKSILSKNKKIIDLVTNPEYQWELEGIKFITDKITL